MGIENKEIKTAIVCGGVINDLEWLKENLATFDYIIAADSGYDYCIKVNISPNVLIGDFDSIKSNIPENTEIIKLPYKKDLTDFDVCLDYCLENGIKNVFVFGAWGGRPGHSFAAVFSGLSSFNKGLCVVFKNENNEMFFVNDYMEIPKSKNYISVFALGETSPIVTLEGFEYPLENYLLEPCKPLGVSNRVSHEKGVIKIKGGIVLVIKE